jgi:hypothetical protein
MNARLQGLLGPQFETVFGNMHGNARYFVISLSGGAGPCPNFALQISHCRSVSCVVSSPSLRLRVRCTPPESLEGSPDPDTASRARSNDGRPAGIPGPGSNGSAGVTCAVIVQAVAHASTTGLTGVHRLLRLCNNEVLPKGMHRNFTERFLYMDGPFLPNSFKTFFRHDVERLSQLRNNADIRQVAQ